MNGTNEGRAFTHQHPTRKPLVLLVGPETEERRAIGRTLLERGRAVLVCSGPPGCMLLREDHCPLVDTADVTVIMPTQSVRNETVAGLSECARRARRPVIVHPSVIEHLPSRAAIAPHASKEHVLAAIERAVGRENVTTIGRRSVPDVADIWL